MTLTSPDLIFEPLRFRNLTVKNRVFRSNISGRFDLYDGTGTETRINWELKFARGGVGAILSSWTPVDVRGRIVPGYGGLDRDDRIPFWRELGRRVHEHDCKYIVQLCHSGRQREIPPLAFQTGLSSTGRADPFHGFPCERATAAQLREIAESFAEAAHRAREAGVDGVEIHGANGYLFTQFLSSAINDRQDEYGGPLENRARFLLEVVRAVRARVGFDYHLQVKISGTEHNKALVPWADDGNGIEESVQVCKWLEEAGVDAIHVSRGISFPHPENPAGEHSVKDVVGAYDVMLSSGSHTFRTYLMLRTPLIGRLTARRWATDPGQVQEHNLADARAIKRAVAIPVLCTGGFQSASVIAGAIERGDCDGVTIARALIANNNLVDLFAQGQDGPAKPCTYCNKCLYNVLEHPLGCYDERRFGSRDEMIAEIMSVFDPVPSATNVVAT
jgi:2,4-dienoyl-CoA reductase-like NADH-dependent reductase (Old Yellow Enzyme family)